MVRPHTKRQLKTFLGLCNYYHDYVPHYAETEYCLTELTKKKMPEELWTEGHDKVSHKLKKSLIKAPSLNAPILGQPFVIYSDAFSTGVRACLSQKRQAYYIQSVAQVKNWLKHVKIGQPLKEKRIQHTEFDKIGNLDFCITCGIDNRP